jgi:hypothetical protein
MGRKHVARKEVEFKQHDGTEVKTSYENLIQAKFKIVNHSNGKNSSFELYLGTEGAWRGTPVQIVHQPNWWFKVILNLNPASSPNDWTADP